MNLPKVLIINQPFNNNTGGGITLSNLFRGWDKDKIAVVCQSYLLRNFDHSICDNYYQLGEKEHKFVFPFNILKRKHYSGPVKIDLTKKQNESVQRPKGRTTLVLKYFNPILKFLGLFNNISKTKPSPELFKWINDFSPDIIYAQATGREALTFIYLIQSGINKPLIFHMMDDWPAIAGKGLLKYREREKNEKEFRKLLVKTNILLTISNEMTEQYRKKYDKESIAFHNPIDTEFWNRYQRKNYEINNSPSFLYAGRIGLGVEKSLELVAMAIQKINHQLNLSAIFVLQTKEKPIWSTNYPCVKYRSFVQYNELPKTFSEADFLILPYDFSVESIQYIGFSMPTKATEYMISGTPIIIWAPMETAIVNYATKYKWAAVVTDNNINSLCLTIKNLIEDKELRQQTAQNAILLAEKNHSAIKVKDDFREVINTLLK